MPKEKTIFSKIIDREIPAHFIYEDEYCVAILDKFPAVTGQSLVIPRQEIDYAFSLDRENFLHLMQVARRIAKASDTALQTARTCMVIEGFEVPHAHIKLYPVLDTDTPLGKIMPEGQEADDATLEDIALQIKTSLAKEN